MSFGAGHIQDMNNRIKQNRAQRPSNREKFKGKNREAIYSDSNKKTKRSNFKTVSPEKLTEIKNKIREQTKKERKKERTINIISILCGLIILILVLIWI